MSIPYYTGGSDGRLPQYKPPKPKTESSEAYKERHKLYCRKPWLNLRAAKLRQSPLCEQCLRRSVHTEARHVHHVEDVADAPHLMYTLSNLESLCVPCHSSITTRRRMNRRDD